MNFLSLKKIKLSKVWRNHCVELTCVSRLYCNFTKHMSHFSYACTEGENGISCLISTLCINFLSAILEYSRIINHSIIWMCIWCGLLQKLHKIKKSEHLNTGREQLIQSHSSARFCFELSGNSN